MLSIFVLIYFSMRVYTVAPSIQLSNMVRMNFSSSVHATLWLRSDGYEINYLAIQCVCVCVLVVFSSSCSLHISAKRSLFSEINLSRNLNNFCMCLVKAGCCCCADDAVDAVDVVAYVFRHDS